MPDLSTSLLVTDGNPSLTSYTAYTQQGGYQALRKALGQMSPADVIAEVQASGLRGRGGSGVAAASKMALVAATHEGQRYVVCNAYDADTRSLAAQTLLERNPHAVLEGIALAAFAVGASEASRRLSIPLESLANWQRAAKTVKLEEVGRQQKPQTELEAELQRTKRTKRTKRELAEVKMERDLLKKFAAYFAKESR